MLRSEIEELRERITTLEKLVLNIVRIERMSRKNLTKARKALLEETLEDTKHKRNKFLTLDELKRLV